MKNLAFVFSLLVIILTGVSLSINNSNNLENKHVRFASHGIPKNPVSRSIASARQAKMYFRSMSPSQIKPRRYLSSEKKNYLQDVKVK